MNQTVPTRALPEYSDLDQLRRQAKEPLAAFLAGSPAAIAEVNEHYHGANSLGFALHDAQLALARAFRLRKLAEIESPRRWRHSPAPLRRSQPARPRTGASHAEAAA